MRIKKKLTEKTSWYKEKNPDIPEDKSDRVRREKVPETGKQLRRKRKREPERRSEEEPKPKEARKSTIKAVLFCPHTEGGILAKRLREAEEKLESLTGYRLKIVQTVQTTQCETTTEVEGKPLISE